MFSFSRGLKGILWIWNLSIVNWNCSTSACNYIIFLRRHLQLTLDSQYSTHPACISYVFVLVTFLSSWYSLKSPREREPPLRSLGLLACLYDIYFIVNWYVVSQSMVSVSILRHVRCHTSFFFVEFISWLHSVMDYDLKF